MPVSDEHASRLVEPTGRRNLPGLEPGAEPDLESVRGGLRRAAAGSSTGGRDRQVPTATEIERGVADPMRPRGAHAWFGPVPRSLARGLLIASSEAP